MDIKIDTTDKICFCWDRDGTVNIGKWPGPIPVEWVEYLAHETHHEVWATGNQSLKQEADIPGTSDLLDSIPGHEAVLHRNPGRRERLRLVKRVVDADLFVVIDDVDLKDMEEEGFFYYTPDDFIDSFIDRLNPIKKQVEPEERYTYK